MTEEMRLSLFTVERAGDRFRIHIETDGGDGFDVFASYDQLDVIADQIDDLLDAEEDTLEVAPEDD